ncbi:MAG: M48 family metalloprotease [Deltaproteobacteria bacterium]|nr:M48 family metalloprotease [Deltaproteobacteria bacterium]
MRQPILTPFLAVAALLALFSSCASPYRLTWRVRDMVAAQSSTINLVGHGEVMATVSKLTMQKILLAHFRITRAAGIQAELLIVDGSDPNAFAGSVNGRPTIGVNLGMLKLIGDDIDEFASLLGHEAAHLARRHGETGRTRGSTLQAIGSLAGMGLAAAGVPAAGTITGLAADLVDTSYSRDDEREADSLGVGYSMSAGYDPYGAVRLHEKMLKVSGATLLPFLSSHPSGQERIENMKALIGAKKPEASGDTQPPQETPSSES